MVGDIVTEDDHMVMAEANMTIRIVRFWRNG